MTRGGSAVAPLTTAALARLDLGRQRWLAGVARRRWAAWALLQPQRRLYSVMGGHAAMALALALWWPMLPLWLAPVVWGPAHVVAQLRHLVMRRDLGGVARGVVWGGAACLGCLQLWRLAADGGGARRAEMVAVAAWLVAGAWAGGREAGSAAVGWRPLAAAAVAAACGLAGILWPTQARLAWVHGHNLVALCVLWLFMRRRGRHAWPLCLCLVAIAALLSSGLAAGATLAAPGVRTLGMHVLEAAACLGPGLPVRYAVGLTSSFVFLQSVHYFVWLWAIPQQELAGRGTPTFAASGRRLAGDLGGGVGLAVLAVVGLWAAAAVLGVRRAASAYLSTVLFHGYLEAVVLVFFLARGRRWA